MRKLLQDSLRPFSHAQFWRIVSWVLALVLLALSLIPMPSRQIDAHWQFRIGWDKLGHMGYIALLSLAIGLGWRMQEATLGNKRTALLVLGWGIFAGALVEVIQYFVPWRKGLDLDDFIADSLGALIGWLSLPLVAYLLKKV